MTTDITDEQIRELSAHHAALDDVHPIAAGHNKHTAVMLVAAVALGELSEAYPGARAEARRRCAAAWAQWRAETTGEQPVNSAPRIV